MGYTYKESGVDLNHADDANRKIAKLAKETFNANVLSNIGSFGGLYQPPEIDGGVIVSSVDGVGTKIMIAADMKRYNTIGQDLVNHCVNDILVMGAVPMFFLDYIGFADLLPDNIARIVEGLAKACRENEIALIGGETAQMPGVYPEKQFDLVGTVVGMVKRDEIITGEKIRPGDRIIALPSSGLHTNGYSLARKVFADVPWDTQYEDRTLGDMLLDVHISYKSDIEIIANTTEIRGMAHITGGGIVGNFKRILPKGISAIIDKDAVPLPKIFSIIQEQGVSEEEMFRVFNMGFGMLIVVSAGDMETVRQALKDVGKDSYVCGEIISSDDEIEIRGL